MSESTWRTTLKELRAFPLRAFLMFWGPLPDKSRSGEDKKAWKAGLRHDLGTRDDKTLDAFTARMQARYDEIEASRASIASRANSLLLFVGVITTGAGLIAQSLVGAAWPLVALFIVDGIFLLYSTVAAAVLAVRAQLVSNWDGPWINLADATDERAVRVISAVELLVAVEQNKVRVRRPVAFLRDGQKYGLAAIAFIAVLAALAVTAAIFKPPADKAGADASPSSSSSPATPAPRQSPSPALAGPSLVVTPGAPSPSSIVTPSPSQ